MNGPFLVHPTTQCIMQSTVNAILFHTLMAEPPPCSPNALKPSFQVFVQHPRTPFPATRATPIRATHSNPLSYPYQVVYQLKLNYCYAKHHMVFMDECDFVNPQKFAVNIAPLWEHE